MVFFPELEFAMTVATNIETNTQGQPKDTLCFAYNAVAGLLLQQDIKCTYSASSYYGSGYEAPIAGRLWNRGREPLGFLHFGLRGSYGPF